MMTFREFLKEETVVTKRQSMVHFQDMKPVEFVEFVKKIKNDLGGKLDSLKFEIKVDGLGGRFGKDADGRVFFEGSRTGPVFDSGSFSNHARQKGSALEIIARAIHYDDMLELFKTSKFMNVIPPNRKVICEIFYNPMATEDVDGITFVNVKYDKNKLGSKMTIVPRVVLDASTGEVASDESTILAALLKQSNSEVKFMSADLQVSNVDLSGRIDPILSLDDEAIRILKSRLKTDDLNKKNLVELITKVKDNLADYILNHPGIVDKFKMGPDIEGIVLYVDGRDYKITSNLFKEKMASKRMKPNDNS